MIGDKQKNIYCVACDCILFESDIVQTQFYWDELEGFWKLDIMIVCPECDRREYVFVPVHEFVGDDDY